jgi:hypothetical protein
LNLSVSREISGCKREALTHTDLGSHSPLGQRHLDAPRSASEPAKVHVPWSHFGRSGLPLLDGGSLAQRDHRAGMLALNFGVDDLGVVATVKDRDVHGERSS